MDLLYNYLMKKLLWIMFISLLWFNTLYAHEETTTYTLEDLLFEMNSFVGRQIHITGFLFINKQVGNLNGIIVDPKDPDNKILSVNINLKTGNYKKLYKFCQSQMKNVYDNRLYGGHIPCGDGYRIHLDISRIGLWGQTIRHMSSR